MRTYKKGEELTPDEITFIMKGMCPDCGEPLYMGPEGGVAQNLLCLTAEQNKNANGCGSRFNTAMYILGTDVCYAVRLTDSPLQSS
jgi:hypothetical protein